MKLLVSLLMSLLLSSVFLAGAFSIEDEDKFIYCDNFNYSLGECITFWNDVEAIINCSECEVCEVCENCTPCNCTNDTQIINQTYYLEKNCSDEFEFLQETNRHEEELARIENGAVKPIDCITEEECSFRISEAVSNANPPSTTPSVVQGQNPNSFTGGVQNKTPWYFPVVLVVVIGAVGLYFFLKLKKGYSRQPSIPDSLLDEPGIVPPAVPRREVIDNVRPKPPKAPQGDEGRTENQDSF
jgi:hypothetical protein